MPLQFAAKSAILMDPQSGETGMASFVTKQNETGVKIQMQAGEALIIKVSTQVPKKIPKWKYINPIPSPLLLNGDWNLYFTNGGPVIPQNKKMQHLQPWNKFEDDTTTQNFSGTGVYTTWFNLPAKKAQNYLLSLGKVHESARVFINGKEVGILWSIPFQARIGKYLKTGKNTIRIEVANLMANRIRYMDRTGQEWRKYHEINFVNIDYKNFNASTWKVQPSGLEGPVTITPF